MASNMGTRESRDEYYKLQLRQQFKQGLRARSVYDFRGPFHGYTPDLPSDSVDETYWYDCLGLVIKSGPSKIGSVIMNDAGFEKVDSTNLPLGDATDTNNDICAIGQFNLTDANGEETTTLSRSVFAITAGNGSTNGSGQLWTFSESETAWREVPYSGTPGGTGLEATIDGDITTLRQRSMVDWTEFPLGAPNRTADTGAISTPALIFTNNSDKVMVFPAGDGDQTDYEELNDDRFNGTFKCISVETYNDRVYFLNTLENDTRVKNKIRRTARGTCDFLETTAGAGSIIVEQLTTGLRLLTLGDILVAYFDDGIAFVRDTFNPAAPNSVQIVSPRSARRGILGTHAVVEVPGRGHFGIYNDGWWMLDPNGRMTELGLSPVQTGRSRAGAGDPTQEVGWKWKRTFYNTLNSDLGHRIQCVYEPKHNWVRIILPKSATDSEIWIYDVDNDRVFRNEYANPPTVYGKSIIQLDTATAWSDMTSEIWSDVVGTWESYGADQGQQFLLHGDLNGNVFLHKEDLITQDGNQPQWNFTTVDSDFGSSQALKRMDKIDLRHVHSGNSTGATVQITTANRKSESRSKQLDSSDGDAGDIEIHQTWFTDCASETFKISFSGSGPVQIKGYMFHLVERQSERHE